MQEGACSNLLSNPSEFKPQKHIQSLIQETSWGCLLGGGRPLVLLVPAMTIWTALTAVVATAFTAALFPFLPGVIPGAGRPLASGGKLLKEFLWLNCPEFVHFFWDTTLKLRQCPLFILGHGLEIQCPWLWGVLAKTRCGFLWIRVHILASFPCLFHVCSFVDCFAIFTYLIYLAKSLTWIKAVVARYPPAPQQWVVGAAIVSCDSRGGRIMDTPLLQCQKELISSTSQMIWW